MLLWVGVHCEGFPSPGVLAPTIVHAGLTLAPNLTVVLAEPYTKKTASSDII